MACEYTLVANGCFLEITATDTVTLISHLERQLNLSTISWRDSPGDDIQLRDGDGNVFTADIDTIPAFANIAALIAFLDPLRAACTMASGGGGGGLPVPIPTDANTTVTYAIATGAGSTAAGLWAVAITNIGATDGTVDGVKIVPFQTIEYTGYYDVASGIFNRLPAVAYNGTGTELAISTIL